MRQGGVVIRAINLQKIVAGLPLGHSVWGLQILPIHLRIFFSFLPQTKSMYTGLISGSKLSVGACESERLFASFVPTSCPVT